MNNTNIKAILIHLSNKNTITININKPYDETDKLFKQILDNKNCIKRIDNDTNKETKHVNNILDLEKMQYIIDDNIGLTLYKDIEEQEEEGYIRIEVNLENKQYHYNNIEIVIENDKEYTLSITDYFTLIESMFKYENNLCYDNMKRACIVKEHMLEVIAVKEFNKNNKIKSVALMIWDDFK